MAAHGTTYTFQTSQGAGYTPQAGKAVPATHVLRAFENSMALFQGDQALDQLRGVILPASIAAGTYNDYALDDQCVTLTVTGAGAVTFTGFTNGRSGRFLVVKNGGTNSIFFAHTSGSSIAANRIGCFSSQGQWIGGLGSAVFQYDGTLWRLMWIVPGVGVAWTPTIVSAGGAGVPTYGAQTGKFIQFAEHVALSGRITLTNKGTLPAGVISIGGLPLTADATVFGAINIPYFNLLATGWNYIGAYIQVSDTKAPLIGTKAAATGISQMQVLDLGGTDDLIFTGQYQISI